MNYTKIKGAKNGIEAEVLFFVPLKTWAEVQKVTIKNTSNETKKIKLFSFEEIQETVFKSLREGKQLIPLYWIEKLHLFESGAFNFIEKALDNLCEIDTHNLLNTDVFHIQHYQQ